MLRLMVFVCAMSLSGMAEAQEFPNSAVGMEVRGDNGALTGRVEQVTRDQRGRIVSAALPDEPADAPAASPALVAEQPEFHIPASYQQRQAQARRSSEGEGGGGGRALR